MREHGRTQAPVRQAISTGAIRRSYEILLSRTVNFGDQNIASGCILLEVPAEIRSVQTTRRDICQKGDNMAAPKPARISSFRSSPPLSELIADLGPLAELPGVWSGKGFNLIARPDHEGGNDIFLELNLTEESLVLDAIGGNIPNRGTAQD